MKTKIINYIYQWLPLFFYFLGCDLLIAAAFVCSTVLGLAVAGVLALVSAVFTLMERGEG